MRSRMSGVVIGAALGFALFGPAQAQSDPPGGEWWGSDMPGRWMQGGWARHRYLMTSGVPAPYAAGVNPLPWSEDSFRRGADIYTEHCASCHGDSGHGDGPAAASLSPPPADLAWLSAVPMAQWDAYMNWTISEGGAPFGSFMPAYKEALSQDEIWAVTGYIQSQLPLETRLEIPVDPQPDR